MQVSVIGLVMFIAFVFSNNLGTLRDDLGKVRESEDEIEIGAEKLTVQQISQKSWYKNTNYHYITITLMSQFILYTMNNK